MSRWLVDPRHYQIATLAALLAYGVLRLDFDVSAGHVLAVVLFALGVQLACTQISGLARFEWRSALISSMSLCLLLRTNELVLALLAAAVAISSKFLLRIGGKHVFNPTNLGIVVMMLLTRRVWVSPGQWGSAAFFGLLVAGIGGLVVNRAERSDVTWAFMAFYLALLFGRSVWLGEPMQIPIHRLQNGALLIFTFFMISDPKTTPDARAGRVLFAALVAAGAYWVQFVSFRTNGLLWSLALFSLLTPLIDRLVPATRYDWRASPISVRTKGASMKPILATSLLVATLLVPRPAAAFCGFYVAKADTQLFNEASKVVLVRDEDHTVLTMVNDFKGDVRDFAVVVPVPTFLERGQIHVGDRALIDHLDAYSAPRLVEYHDEDPCAPVYADDGLSLGAMKKSGEGAGRAESLGVTIEARYTVGEYDIVILSAEQSDGLETWLVESGYKIPAGASEVLGSYIKQNMRFFVAKVDLTEHDKLGFSYLRPLQVAYDSPKFMLPIRLGTVNANGPQELFVFALTRTGRVETTNYRTVKLPSGMDVPIYVKDEFGAFYKDMFAAQVKKEDMRAVFVEYAWDMAWCDPCAADPLTPDELRQLGVFWLDGGAARGGAQNVFVTRLHLRYDRAHFPEDLVFQATADRENFQGRYVLRHPFTGKITCDQGQRYVEELKKRREQEAHTLSELTGWNVVEIRRKMDLTSPMPQDDRGWWQRLWGD